MNKNIYTNVYKKELNNKNFDFPEPAENFIRMYKMFIKKKNLKCLDYGVGDGRHFEFLVRRQHNVVGTDVSDYAIDLTKRRKFDFITAEKKKKTTRNLFKLSKKKNLNSLKLENLDLIVCWETIHWLGSLKKIDKLISDFTSILKSKGKIFITFPSEKHYLLKKKDLIEKFTYKISSKERKKMIICSPDLNYLKRQFKKKCLKILGIYKYSHGRKIYVNKRNQLLSSDFKNKLFSMYGFVLEKK